MKKRKAVWLVILCVGLCIGSVYFWKNYRTRPQDTRPIATDVSLKSTWSGFQEYQKLKLLFEGLKIQTVIDLPSRDLEWLKQSPLKIHSYIGAVSSRDEADAAYHRFGSKQTSFVCYRPAVDPLPEADLLLAWDFFDQLSPRQIKAILLHLKKSGIKFLLVAHAPEVEKNLKHPEGEAVSINWKLAPYGFPDPMIQLACKKEGKIRILALWNTEDLP